MSDKFTGDEDEALSILGANPKPVLTELAGETNVVTGEFTATGEKWDPSLVSNEETTENAFCPTGPGGGIKPNCEPHQVRTREEGLNTVESTIGRKNEEPPRSLSQAISSGDYKLWPSKELVVETGRLIPTQEFVHSEKVAGISAKETTEPPTAVLDPKTHQLYIADGHNRIAVEALRGRKKLKIVMYAKRAKDLPAETAFGDQQTQNAFCHTGHGGGIDPHCKTGHGPVSIAKGKERFVGAIVGSKEREHTDKLEKSVAKLLKGEWGTDNEFWDAKTPDGKHYVEVKSMMVGGKQQFNVHADAMLRKVEGMQKAGKGAQFHMVLFDERKTYNGGSNAGAYSGHRLYYKRGAKPVTQLSEMHPVKSLKELLLLIKAKDKDLPKKARGSLKDQVKRIDELRQIAADAKVARTAKDSKRKQRLKDMGTSAYTRQT
jgi:hypothetical protein